MTIKDLTSVYDPSQFEQRIYERWESAGYFAPKGSGDTYCIMIPPPNVTGSLHMGHAFQCTLMDALIRYNRMKGRDALWQAGTDHAGIATQMVVERLLQAQGQSRTELGRSQFIDRIWDWKAQSGGTISNQLRRLGSSLDWSRERFTMDEDLSKAVQEVFVSLYEEGLIYRGKRLVNWDPVLLTAISDLEVISTEEDGFLWHFRYPISESQDYVTIATTRPETMLGDTAVAVHPDDERYSHLVGRMVELPLVNRQIPIVADSYVDPEFGTGCVKITPGHDFNDFAVGQRQNLEVLNIMTPQAHIELPGTEYHGLSRFDARSKVVEDLKDLGLVVEIEKHRYKVPRGDRTGQIIEPYLTDQWFVRVEPLAEAAIDVVRSGKVKFVPKNWENTYFDWMENIEDWCISRQIWWGHRIPAWYDSKGNVFVARSQSEALQQAQEFHGRDDTELNQDGDVLDTWFSSALWPFSTLGWPRYTDELKKFYPTNVLVTGFDIIFFWVARMIMFGVKFADDIPFDEVYIHGLVRDSEGQKMSKSKGNILDPLDLIDGIDLEALLKKRTTGLMQPELAPRIDRATRSQFPNGIPAYGTDALRFTFARLATQGRDIRFDLGQIGGYRNFCNKIWNAARFVLLNASDVEPYSVYDFNPQTNYEKWIVSNLSTTIDDVERAIEVYRFDLASKAIYDFIWNEYCAWFIEFAKVKLQSETTEDVHCESLKRTLLMVLEASLRLLHPFMPFITEEIWQKIRTDKQSESIMLEQYSNDFGDYFDPSAVAEVEWVRKVISCIRNLRGEISIDAGKRVSAYYQCVDDMHSKYLEINFEVIQELATLELFCEFQQYENQENNSEQSNFISHLVDDFRVLLQISDIENIDKKIDHLNKQIDEQMKFVKSSEAKLNNTKFVANAPAEIVDRERERLVASNALIEELSQRRRKLEVLFSRSDR